MKNLILAVILSLTFLSPVIAEEMSCEKLGSLAESYKLKYQTESDAKLAEFYLELYKKYYTEYVERCVK